MRELRAGRLRAAIILLATMTACRDTTPTSADPPLLGGGNPMYEVPPLKCGVTLTLRNPTCTSTSTARTSFGYHFDPMLLGGQWGALVFANGMYDRTTGLYWVDVAVRNVSGQSLGTTDGHSLAPGGVRLVFTAVDTGAAAPRLLTTDGRGSFTAEGQAFIQYDEVLQPGAQSHFRTLYWKVPAGATTMAFQALLAGQVPFPDGWIELSPATATVSVGSTIFPQPIIHEPLGPALASDKLVDLSGATYTSDDTTIARFSSGPRVQGRKVGKTVVHMSLPTFPGVSLPGSMSVSVVPAPWPSSARPQ